MDIFAILGLLMFTVNLNIIVECASLGRQKRFILASDQATIAPRFPFPVPTTMYPAPTIRNGGVPLTPPTKTTTRHGLVPTTARQLLGNGPQGNGLFTGNTLLNAVSVNCPRKRSADARRIILDDRLMEELYLSLIGGMDLTRMARSSDEAMENFLHPESMTKERPNQQDRKKRSPSSMTMQSVRSDLGKFQPWFDTMSSKYLTNRTDTSNRTETAQDSYSTIYSHLMEILETVEITMEQLKQILGLINDVEDIIGLRLKSEHRAKRSMSGSRHDVSYCNTKDNQTADGYLHMCASCAGTTQLPDDTFPRFINEIECDSRDCNCFTVNGTPNGKCVQRTHAMKVLRKKQHGCRVLTHDGQQYILDDWEVVDHDVKVGCECLFNKNSLFAQFVRGH